jgi:hypothetical protein
MREPGDIGGGESGHGVARLERVIHRLHSTLEHTKCSVPITPAFTNVFGDEQWLIRKQILRAGGVAGMQISDMGPRKNETG